MVVSSPVVINTVNSATLFKLVGNAQGGGSGNWILATGFWDDGGIWDDTDVWND